MTPSVFVGYVLAESVPCRVESFVHVVRRYGLGFDVWENAFVVVKEGLTLVFEQGQYNLNHPSANGSGYGSRSRTCRKESVRFRAWSTPTRDPP